MSVDQVFVTWSLMSIQGIRRLLESITAAKASTSKMFFAHWLLGLLFYLAMGLAVWVEGAGKHALKLPRNFCSMLSRITYTADLLTFASIWQKLYG